MTGIFGALTTGVSGLKGTGSSLNHISDNIANVTTVGYKRVDTRFQTLVTTSNGRVHSAGGAVTTPQYRINAQGLQEQSDVGTHMSVTGSGMFVVTDEVSNTPLTSFGQNFYYTRAGDFGIDENGYLKNGNGYYLQGWNLDANGDVQNVSQIQPLRVTGLVSSPTATTQVDYQAIVPSDVTPVERVDIAAEASPQAILDDPNHPAHNSVFGPDQIVFYDSLGGEHTMSLYWTRFTDTRAGAPAAYSNPNFGFYALTVMFDSTIPGNTMTVRGISPITGTAINGPMDMMDALIGFRENQPGEPRSIGGIITNTIGLSYYDDGGVPPLSGGTGNVSADFSFELTYSGSYLTGTTQNITIDLGETRSLENSTVSWDTDDVDVLELSQDGKPAGTMQDLSIDGDGVVNIDYDNGTSQAYYKIPMAQFSNYDGLQLTHGNAYTVTSFSGDAFYTHAGENGVGTFTSNSIERSNVDLADEFTKMIVIQRAYSANARIVTVASQLLEEVTSI